MRQPQGARGGWRRLLRWLVPWLAAAVSAGAQAQVIYLFSYHAHPPFVTGPASGATYRLAERLNAVAPPGLRVEVALLPRIRLDQRLREWLTGRCPAAGCDDNWLVPWVNPAWGFEPPGGAAFRWLPLGEDANVVVSRRAAPLDYRGPASLDGHLFAGMRGHQYPGIDERVAAGLIERVDGNLEREILLMLLYRRVDAVLLPESTVDYLFKRDPLLRQRAGELYIAAGRQQRYRRSLMLPAGRQDLWEWVKRAGLGQQP